MALVVPIHRVTPNNRDKVVKTFVNKMMDVLQRQGQIEPLQVQVTDNGYVTFEQDAYGADTVLAARALGWPTILIVETTKFEQ